MHQCHLGRQALRLSKDEGFGDTSIAFHDTNRDRRRCRGVAFNQSVHQPLRNLQYGCGLAAVAVPSAYPVNKVSLSELMPKLLVIADDLTGASDIGVQFARKRIPVFVATGVADVALSLAAIYQVWR